MKIVKTKTIEAKDISEISDEKLIGFKDRTNLHDSSIPNFFVYIQDYAWNAFVSHGNNVYRELRHEAQGIFTGYYFKDQFGEFVVATSYQEGSGNSQSAYVEMSEECLAKISEKCQEDNTLMLIWVHTHPGLGVFYSGTDYNCLKTNFYKPYQIGIVVDILKKQHKGFKTKDSFVFEFSDYALFNDEKNNLFFPYENNKIEFLKKDDNQTVKLKEKVKRLKNELNYRTLEIEQCKEKIQIKEKDIESLNLDLQCKEANIIELINKVSNIEQVEEELKCKEENIEYLNSSLQYKAELILKLEEDLQNKISEIEQIKQGNTKHSWFPWKKNKQK